MENTSNTRSKRSKKKLDIQTPIFPSKRLTRELKKQLTSFNSLLKKAKINSYIMSNNLQQNESVYHTHEKLEILRKFTSKNDNIESLPHFLITSQLFNSYQSCQLLVHEKGKTAVDSYFFSKDAQSMQTKIEVSKYNHLYNLVKKSKRKLFFGDQITEINLNILGAFLAKDFDFKNHSIVLILSRNSFLPSTSKEISYFNNLTRLLLPTLNTLLKLHASKIQNDICESLAFGFPVNLSISPPYRQNIEPGFGDIIEEHKIDDNNTICLSMKREHSAQYDTYHLHRINLLGELLNTLKHEISNPLFGIKLGCELLTHEEMEKESLLTLADIENSCDRCQNIMNSFNYLYNQKEHFAQTDIVKLVNETITLTKSETRQIKKVIIFDQNLSDKYYNIKTNPTYLSQIIFNLIINASQSIRAVRNNGQDCEKSITITIVSHKDSINIMVKDTGEGINEKIIDKVFDPFFTTKLGGTGLGLSICNNLAKQIGATMSCTNNSSGQGSTFYLKILQKT